LPLGCFPTLGFLKNQEKIDKNEAVIPEVEQLDFEFVLFASTVVDYDYISFLKNRLIVVWRL
jgi:type I restriction enzyme R subunit